MGTEVGTGVLHDGDGGSLRLPGIKLTVIEGPDAGKEVVARRGVLRVGTAEGNDLRLSDGAVSRHHLEIRLQSHDVHVLDLESTNGSTVDGVQVVEAILSPASLIRLGTSTIRATAIDEPVTVPLSNRDRFGSLLGGSVAMRQVFGVLERVAATETTVLLEGETGTGKELAAEAIHAHSSRVEGPFVTVDCGAIAPSLMESELFGHARGAFTGAVAERSGVFEEADGGTLFLDEIGELPLELQPKLLRALEKREVRRIGASGTRRVDVRLISATHRDLGAEVNRGSFREDLYYRLAVVRVQLPPLRARREDIPALVRAFLERLAPDSPHLSEEFLQALSHRPWPGNVRELRNAVERAVAFMTSDDMASSQTSKVRVGTEDAMRALFSLPIKEAIEQWSTQFERAYLKHVLELNGGSVSGAARAAGVNRRYIQRLIARHGMREDKTDL